MMDGSCAHPNFVSSGHALPRFCNAAWECPPFRGRATDAREKESSLTILRPEGRGPFEKRKAIRVCGGDKLGCDRLDWCKCAWKGGNWRERLELPLQVDKGNFGLSGGLRRWLRMAPDGRLSVLNSKTQTNPVINKGKLRNGKDDPSGCGVTTRLRAPLSWSLSTRWWSPRSWATQSLS
ncbi:hypothetical protein CRG98_045305 [Punica granatum]|uniref:Uncharacterized protein n=1 Tax=Punica granatum TaxID=22663 RepID=A0A2I0HRH2_PUNGR|nr:hypothetical protein CRG98_045305 [Punica granatum]